MLPACFLKQSSTCVFQNPWVVRPAGIHSGTAMSRGLYHPATIFMGHHMSAAWSMQQKASHAAESHSVPEPCSHRQAALSSDETGRCFPRVGSDMPCTNKPDKQDAKADVLVWEKMPITSGVALAESSMRSSLTNLTERRNPAECRSLSPNRGSVESRTADLNSDISVEEEDVTREHLVASAEDKQPVPVAFVPEPGISEEDQESIPGMMEPLPDCAGAHISQTDAPGGCFFPYTSCILLEVYCHSHLLFSSSFDCIYSQAIHHRLTGCWSYSVFHFPAGVFWCKTALCFYSALLTSVGRVVVDHPLLHPSGFWLLSALHCEQTKGRRRMKDVQGNNQEQAAVLGFLHQYQTFCSPFQWLLGGCFVLAACWRWTSKFRGVLLDALCSAGWLL